MQRLTSSQEKLSKVQKFESALVDLHLEVCDRTAVDNGEDVEYHDEQVAAQRNHILSKTNHDLNVILNLLRLNIRTVLTFREVRGRNETYGWDHT